MGVKYITLKMGEAAESFLGTLIFTADTTYETPQEAVASLATALLEKYLYDQFRFNSCCAKRKKNWKYCANCGTDFNRRAPTVDSFEAWLRHLNTIVADRYESELAGWHPFNSVSVLLAAKEGDGIVDIGYYGETVMAAAVDLSKIDDPFARIMEKEEWHSDVSCRFIPDDYLSLIPRYSYNP